MIFSCSLICFSDTCYILSVVRYLHTGFVWMVSKTWRRPPTRQRCQPSCMGVPQTIETTAARKCSPICENQSYGRGLVCLLTTQIVVEFSVNHEFVYLWRYCTLMSLFFCSGQKKICSLLQGPKFAKERIINKVINKKIASRFTLVSKKVHMCMQKILYQM